MKKISLIIVCLVVVVLFALAAEAQLVTAKSVSSGTYENGRFSPGTSGFEGKYLVNEAKGEVTIEKVIRNDREGKIDKGYSFEITNIVVSDGLSGFLVSRDKKRQKIITAVREAELGAFDVLIIGEDFYEYSRAANGKFYLEYGDVDNSGK
ncbi:MAG: hypothetical protein P9L88_05440 [Candidatus Tantalella remota]|nr:hypothetical protein [Candidatus Tantalella remota]